MWSITLSLLKSWLVIVSDVWEQMNFWKRVFSNCFEVLNANQIMFVLIEWKIIKYKLVCVFITWTIICHCCKIGW